MLSSFRFWVVVALLVAIAGGYWSRSPYGTRLPLEVADLSPIQAQLDKLPEADRKLVVGYLERSNGDVLPPAFADPDEPFTARTFRQAIALQKDFLVKQGERDAAAHIRQQEREALMAPLRKATSVRMLNREVLSGDAIYRRPAQSAFAATKSAASADDGNNVLVVTYRLHNLSARAITAVQGTVSVRDSADEEVAHCFIDHDEKIDAGSSVDIRCGLPNRPASAADIAFITVPMNKLTLRWEPRTLLFADGTKLQTGL